MADSAAFLYLAISFAIAVVAVALTNRLLGGGGGRGLPAIPGGASRGADMLRRYRFHEGYLLSDIDADDAFLEAGIDRALAFGKLVAALGPLSPDFAPRLEALRARGQSFLIDGRIGADCVSLGGFRDDEDATLTISVGPAGDRGARRAVDVAALEAMQAELGDLRATLDAGQIPMWRLDDGDRVIWANAAYFDLVERLRGGDRPGWPLPQLFAGDLDPAPADGTTRRCRLDLPDRDEPAWFEISRDRLPGGSALFIAQPADRAIRAEGTLRDFLQTTTKTFAALPIGLAVFDRRRQLVTFNPALCTLTLAGPEFLSARPDLRAFLGQLRNRGRIPEPRDYRAWRDEIARLEQGAETGTYHELWELPEDKTFRVIGRPHPDGAIAFMFEDISAEVSLTRRFRADLDMYQAVLDATPSAIVVFDADGAMIGSNEGYARLWGRDPRMDGSLPTLGEATAQWSARCRPSGLWDDIRQFVAHRIERVPSVEEVETEEGTRVAVRIAPARGRATVIHFMPLDASLPDPLASLAPAPARRIEAAEPPLPAPPAREAMRTA